MREHLREEFSTISRGNHVNVFDVSEVIEVEDGRFDLLLDWLDANPDGGDTTALVQFNHPRGGKRAVADYGRDDFGEDGEVAWLQPMGPRISLIEVFNAPALKRGVAQRTHDNSSQFKRYLNLGFHLAPGVGQDNHYDNWGVSTDARVAVVAPEFTRRGIVEALRRRHDYASEDRNLRVVFCAGGAMMGDVTDPPAIGEELLLTVQIVDEDEEHPIDDRVWTAAAWFEDAHTRRGRSGSSPCCPIRSGMTSAENGSSSVTSLTATSRSRGGRCATSPGTPGRSTRSGRSRPTRPSRC